MGDTSSNSHQSQLVITSQIETKLRDGTTVREPRYLRPYIDAVKTGELLLAAPKPNKLQNLLKPILNPKQKVLDMRWVCHHAYIILETYNDMAYNNDNGFAKKQDKLFNKAISYVKKGTLYPKVNTMFKVECRFPDCGKLCRYNSGEKSTVEMLLQRRSHRKIKGRRFAIGQDYVLVGSNVYNLKYELVEEADLVGDVPVVYFNKSQTPTNTRPDNKRSVNKNLRAMSDINFRPRRFFGIRNTSQPVLPTRYDSGNMPICEPFSMSEEQKSILPFGPMLPPSDGGSENVPECQGVVSFNSGKGLTAKRPLTMATLDFIINTVGPEYQCDENSDQGMSCAESNQLSCSKDSSYIDPFFFEHTDSIPDNMHQDPDGSPSTTAKASNDSYNPAASAVSGNPGAGNDPERSQICHIDHGSNRADTSRATEQQSLESDILSLLHPKDQSGSFRHRAHRRALRLSRSFSDMASLTHNFQKREKDPNAPSLPPKSHLRLRDKAPRT